MDFRVGRHVPNNKSQAGTKVLSEPGTTVPFFYKYCRYKKRQVLDGTSAYRSQVTPRKEH